MTSQAGQFLLGTSCDVIATSEVCQSHLGNSWYFAMMSQIGRFYPGASVTSLPYKLRLIYPLRLTFA